jgi:hypothetical protein
LLLTHLLFSAHHFVLIHESRVLHETWWRASATAFVLWLRPLGTLVKEWHIMILWRRSLILIHQLRWRVARLLHKRKQEITVCRSIRIRLLLRAAG